MPHSSLNITLGKDERCHFPAFPTTNCPSQAAKSRWQSSSHCRKPASEAAVDYSQQIKTTSTQSVSQRSRPTRLLVNVPESQAYRPVCHYHQAFNPAEIPHRTEEAKVPAAIFTTWRTQARSQGAIQGCHQRHRRNEAPQSSFRLPQDRATNQSGIWPGA